MGPWPLLREGRSRKNVARSRRFGRGSRRYASTSCRGHPGSGRNTHRSPSGQRGLLGWRRVLPCRRAQKASGPSAPGKRQPIPITAIGSRAAAWAASRLSLSLTARRASRLGEKVLIWSRNRSFRLYCLASRRRSTSSSESSRNTREHCGPSRAVRRRPCARILLVRIGRPQGLRSKDSRSVSPLLGNQIAASQKGSRRIPRPTMFRSSTASSESSPSSPSGVSGSKGCA